MQRSKHSSLFAAAAIAGLGALAQAMPAPRKGSARDYRPAQPKRDTELQREIADHNAEVDRLKAEKRDRKRNRGSAPGGA